MGFDSLPHTGTPECQILPVQYPSPEFDTIVHQLWKHNSRWLGFMPTQGFRDRAQRETLFAALVEGKVAGYVLFDLPRDVVKIIHLCVDTSYQGKGVARDLINEVGEIHKDRHGIQLSCREDYPANTLWPKLGFVTMGERPGRSKKGTLLRIWFRSHGHHNLLTPLADELRTTAAMDFNIILDILGESSPRGLTSRYLLDDWITQLADICITEETYQEAGQLETLDERNEIRGQLEQFTRLPVARDQLWQQRVTEVAALIPRAQDPDHRQIADAIVGQSHYFITRDNELMAASETVMIRFGIHVIAPTQFIVNMDQLRSEDRYEPRQLNATRLTVNYTVDRERSFILSFQNYSQAEPRRNLVGILRTAQSTPDTSRITIVRTNTGRDLGCAIVHIEDGTLVVPALRLASRDQLCDTVGRQLCFMLRHYALSEGLDTVRVTDDYLSPSLENSLEDEGYIATNSARVCYTRSGMTSALSVFGKTKVTASAIALYEHQRWPLKLLEGDLETFIIPIRPAYAEQLFDTHSATGTLFGRSTDLGISREHVYYRSWRNSQGLTSPARILWYVSGRTPYQNQGHIRAISQLREVQVGSPLTLYRRFSHLGVYEANDVLRTAAGDGKVMALRFIDTELFDRPVSLSQARAIAKKLEEPFPVLRSPCPVSEGFFTIVYTKGSRHVSQ